MSPSRVVQFSDQAHVGPKLKATSLDESEKISLSFGSTEIVSMTPNV